MTRMLPLKNRDSSILHSSRKDTASYDDLPELPELPTSTLETQKPTSNFHKTQHYIPTGLSHQFVHGQGGEHLSMLHEIEHKVRASTLERSKHAEQKTNKKTHASSDVDASNFLRKAEKEITAKLAHLHSNTQADFKSVKKEDSSHVPTHTHTPSSSLAVSEHKQHTNESISQGGRQQTTADTQHKKLQKKSELLVQLGYEVADQDFALAQHVVKELGQIRHSKALTQKQLGHIDAYIKLIQTMQEGGING